MFKLEDNVPVPELTSGGRAGKYPWKSAKIGQSFFIPAKEDGTPVMPSAPKFEDKKFITRSVEEKRNGEMVKGTRVFCVAKDAETDPVATAKTNDDGEGDDLGLEDKPAAKKPAAKSSAKK